jgi:hypothetical protein
VTAPLTLPLRVGARRAVPATVPGVIGVMAVVRLLEARSAATPDEGGFLLVAGQWHAGGSSLYGNYWVDRPPLLVGLFRLADLTGGLFALRVLGILAAAAAVGMLASTAMRVFGRRAGTWTAVVAATLLVTPLFGAVEVNAELLGLPFLALGLRAAVEAVLAQDRLVARGAGFTAGLAGISALLVLQNLAEVVVFAAVVWILAWRSRRITWIEFAELVGSAAFGGALAYAVVSLAAMAHGTSPYQVYLATYPFRSAASGVRLHSLAFAFLLSGAPLVLVAFLLRGVRRSRNPGVTWALIVTTAWTGFAVLAGGSFWLHDLVEAVPVVALAAGALSLQAPRVARVVVALVLLPTLATGALAVARPGIDAGDPVGAALARVAHPGDTMVTLFGEGDLVQNSGMSSPYPYLWSLPARTQDTDLHLLRATLVGPIAPTWVVVHRPAAADLTTEGVMSALVQHYRAVADLCGHTVYLQRDVSRTIPSRSGPCSRGVPLP